MDGQQKLVPEPTMGRKEAGDEVPGGTGRDQQAPGFRVFLVSGPFCPPPPLKSLNNPLVYHALTPRGRRIIIIIIIIIIIVVIIIIVIILLLLLLLLIIIIVIIASPGII